MLDNLQTCSQSNLAEERFCSLGQKAASIGGRPKQLAMILEQHYTHKISSLYRSKHAAGQYITFKRTQLKLACSLQSMTSQKLEKFSSNQKSHFPDFADGRY